MPILHRIPPLTLPPARDGRECSICDSTHTEVRTGIFPTGVVSPDGGCEERQSFYIACLDCGTEEEL